MELFEPPILDILELYHNVPDNQPPFPSCRISFDLCFNLLTTTAQQRKAELAYERGAQQGTVRFSPRRLTRSAYKFSHFKLETSPEGLVEKITFYKPTQPVSRRLREETCLFRYHFLRNIVLTLYPEEAKIRLVGQHTIPTFFCGEWWHTIIHNDYPRTAEHISPSPTPLDNHQHNSYK